MLKSIMNKGYVSAVAFTVALINYCMELHILLKSVTPFAEETKEEMMQRDSKNNGE